MKRIMVRPGKFVFVSDELVEKSARVAAANLRFSREDVERTAAAEPHGVTVFAGPVKPSQRQTKFRLRKMSSDEASAHHRVAVKVRQMLDAAAVDTNFFDVDAWVVEWMKAPLPQFGDKTPAETIRTQGGWEAVEAALDSMRGGLPS